MIRKIHYCWFGSEKPETVKRNVESWARLNPDFEICEWNESNIDISEWEFGRRALENKRWGFLVDTVRPQMLWKEGGFYVDADVEMLRPLSSLDVENNGDKLLMGYMYECALGTAVLYAPPGHPWIKDILDSYNRIRPDVWPVSNSIFTAYFINRAEGFLLNGKAWQNGQCRLYPKEFFEQPSFWRHQGISVHHCCGSWKNVDDSFHFACQQSLFRHCLKWAKRKYRTWRACQCNEFTPCYRAARRGERLLFDDSKYFIP